MSKKIKDIDSFIEGLAKTKPTKHAVNPWDYSKKENEIRRKNLKAYLLILLKNNSSVLLVGEAPGYRGTRLTGVPFSSEKIILTNSFFTTNKDFDIENKNNPTAESSASIVWKTMDELKFYPLIWASFPFHPHEPGNYLTNRAPTKEELIMGQSFLISLLDIFKIKSIVAIGRAAERTLAGLNMPIATQIRHPSHGGASQFRGGLRLFVETTRVSQ
jgi:uracil-DNA glycosylase